MAGGDHRRGGGPDRHGPRPDAGAASATSRSKASRRPRSRAAPGDRSSRDALSAAPAQVSARITPRRAARHGHDRDHRVDADPRREARAVADVEARRPSRSPSTPVRTRPHVSHGWVRGSAPIRTEPIWCAEKTPPRFGAKSKTARVCLEALESARPRCPDPRPGRYQAAGDPDGDDLGRAGRAGEPRHPDERVTQRRDSRARRARSRSGRGRPWSASPGPRRRRG